ncbi:MAG: PD-(D/E)XK nuclease family protein [Planctomycetes bacterium]|nr:PD-(D/E)XK nuclease family protein [Planctomycetota bacterium]
MGGYTRGMAIEILRVPLGADVAEHVAALLRDAARSAEPFVHAPVVYVTSTDRRGRGVAKAAEEDFPKGTPDYIARELLNLTAPEIHLRGEVERDFDFFGALADTLAELGENRRAGRALVDELLVAWKRLAQTIPPNQRDAKSLGAWLPKLGRRGELFGGVVRRYLERLKKLACHDPEDALWLAGANMRVAPGLVVVDDLDQLSPARTAFLRALSSAAKRAVYILRGSRDALPFLAEAHEASQGLMFEGEGRVLEERDWALCPQADICEAWLEDAPVDRARVRVLRPPSRAAEVREAAREVKRAHAAGVALGEICVAMPSTGGYRELVEEIFAGSGIPYDAPFEIPLDETPPVAALFDLLRAARTGLARGDLLDALNSPFLPFEAPGREAQVWFTAALDEITRDVFVVGGRDVRRDWLEKLEKANHPAWPGVEKQLREILTLLERFTRRSTKAVAFFEALEALAQAANVQRVVDADRLRNDRGAGLRADALHKFGILLRQMREEFRHGGNPELGTGELIRALTEQASTRSVRPPELASDRVRVLGLRELRGMRYARLIVLGLTDQDLPLSEQDTMFLPPSREEALGEVLGKRPARELCVPIDVTAQADYLFAHTLLAAGAQLTLMFPAAEGETPCVPATPFARLLRCLGAEDLDKLPETAGADVPTSPGDLAAAVAQSLTQLERHGGEAPARLKVDTPAIATGLHGRGIELARTDLASPPGEFEGVVGAMDELADRFAASGEGRHTFSPSQLDSYAECPMRFWGRYILRAKAPIEPTLDTKPHAIGTLLHEVFERWVLLLRSELGQSAVEPDPIKRAPVKLSDVSGDPQQTGLRLMADAFARACENNPGEGPFWEGMKKLVAAGLPGQPDEGLGRGLLARFIDAELERNAAGHGIRFVEFDFGKDNGPEPDRPDTVADVIELEIPGGSMRLMGSVDRVDEGPDGLEIIDYKTGSWKTAPEIRDGKAFQLPTYLAAISHIAGTPPRGMMYLHVPPEGAIDGKDVTTSRGKPAFDIHELVTQHLPERLARILEALRNGVFMHTPFTAPDKACKWCDYAASCARRGDVIAERAQRLSEGDKPEVAHVYLPDGGEA